MALKALSWLWTFIKNGNDARAATQQARENRDAAIGTGLTDVAGKEAQGRAEVQKAQTAAGWWWLTMPFLLIAGAAAVYFVALVADTLGGFSWNVEKLPPPFDETMNQIILVTGGVSGGIGALGVLLGRR